MAYEAERLLRKFILSFLEHNRFANRIAGEMQLRTGTDFYEWVDHFTLDTEHAGDLALSDWFAKRLKLPLTPKFITTQER